MHNFLKIILISVISIFFFNFKSNKELTSSKSAHKNVVQNDTVTWRLLGEIKYVKKKHATYGEIDFPIVNAKLKGLAKQTVIISGFIVPIDNKNYAISKNVFAACFFCGKSGPETIAGIHFKDNKTPKIKTDTYVTLKGIFRYNEKDAEDWIYNLDNVEIISGL